MVMASSFRETVSTKTTKSLKESAKWNEIQMKRFRFSKASEGGVVQSRCNIILGDFDKQIVPNKEGKGK
jgi:hypothetical protein